MADKSWNKFRGVVRPVLGPEPILLQLCQAFISNLRLILNVAMVFGAIVLVQEMREVPDEPVAENLPGISIAPVIELDAVEPVINDRIQHWQNCTRTEYRNEHFEACDLDASEFYQRPGADPDDTGFLFDRSPVIFASLSPR